MIAKDCFHLEFEPPIKSIFALSLVPGLKVTTRRAVIGISSPVFGFLPGRATLSRSSNLPKPDSLTDSACSKVAIFFPIEYAVHSIFDGMGKNSLYYRCVELRRYLFDSRRINFAQNVIPTEVIVPEQFSSIEIVIIDRKSKIGCAFIEIKFWCLEIPNFYF